MTAAAEPVPRVWMVVVDGGGGGGGVAGAGAGAVPPPVRRRPRSVSLSGSSNEATQERIQRVTLLLPDLVAVASIAPITALQLKCLIAVQKVAHFTPVLGLSRRGAAALAACLHMLLCQPCTMASEYAVAIAAIRVAGMLMQRLPLQFGPLFTREGVTWRVSCLAKGYANDVQVKRMAARRASHADSDEDVAEQQATKRRGKRRGKLRKSRTEPAAAARRGGKAAKPKSRAMVVRECRNLLHRMDTERTVQSLANLVWRELFQDTLPQGVTWSLHCCHSMLTAASAEYTLIHAAAARLSMATGVKVPDALWVSPQDPAGAVDSTPRSPSRLPANVETDLQLLLSVTRRHAVTPFEFMQAGCAAALHQVLNSELRSVFQAVFCAKSDLLLLVNLVQVPLAACAVRLVWLVRQLGAHMSRCVWCVVNASSARSPTTSHGARPPRRRRL